MTLTREELVNKWAKVLDECGHIPTWTSREELAYLCETASQYDVGVELGTFHGASALVMLRANPRLHLWCVDWWKAYAFNKEIASYFLNKEIAEGRCELITGDSSAAAYMLHHVKGKVGFCFVDDGHESWQVKKDIQFMHPLLQPQGKLVGHDFNSNPFNDVATGVIESGIKYSLPIGSLWESIK